MIRLFQRSSDSVVPSTRSMASSALAGSAGALRLLRAVPGREWPALGAAFGVALFVELGLRVMKLPRLARVVGTSMGLDEGPLGEGPMLQARFTGRAAVRVSATQRLMRHWPCDGNCLRQSLVLGQRLRRYDPVLRVGVRRDESGMIKAHAWLEVEGRTLDPVANAVFRGFVPFQSSDPVQSGGPIQPREGT